MLALILMAVLAVPAELKVPAVLPGELPRDISPCPFPPPPKEKP